MEPLDIYVLGAGASYVHGAPLTNGILPYALTKIGDRGGERLDLVRAFLKDVFHFDPDAADARWENYPGLVDVLSTVDLALDRRESLARRYDQEQLRRVRQALEYAIFKALEHSLSDQTKGQSRRSTATTELVKKLDPARSVIISFNYDVIVDIALSYRFRGDFAFDTADVGNLAKTYEDLLGIDYGLRFANMPIREDSQSRFQLLKLHGSFNWLWSPATDNLYFGGLDKAIAVLFDEPSSIAAQLDYFYEHIHLPSGQTTGDLEPIMITPTHLKDLRNVHLGQLWHRAGNALRNAKSVTFIGYSLPGDDLHIKYLFKRAIETRYLSEAPRIAVVDYAEGTQVTPVQQNYQRFFGRGVRYYRHGYEQYVKEEM